MDPANHTGALPAPPQTSCGLYYGARLATLQPQISILHSSPKRRSHLLTTATHPTKASLQPGATVYRPSNAPTKPFPALGFALPCVSLSHVPRVPPFSDFSPRYAHHRRPARRQGAFLLLCAASVNGSISLHCCFRPRLPLRQIACCATLNPGSKLYVALPLRVTPGALSRIIHTTHTRTTTLCYCYYTPTHHSSSCFHSPKAPTLSLISENDQLQSRYREREPVPTRSTRTPCPQPPRY